MIKKIVFPILLVTTTCLPTIDASASQGSKNTVGVSIGASSLSFVASSTSVRYERDLYSLFSDTLIFSGGARVTHFARSSSLQLGKRTWSVDKVDVTALNLFGAVTFWLAEKASIAMNLDLVGASFGSEAKLESSGGSDTAKPVATNLFLSGRKDRGSLNSEFFIQYSLAESLRLRIGLSHQVVEYRADNEDTDKLQRFYDVAVIGLDKRF